MRHRGLSLLEIIVALAVLTGSAAILAQMVDLGARHAERSREITEAQTLAQNILNELLADMRPWESSETLQPVDLWSPWDYQMQFEPLGLGDLVTLTVTVVERQDETTTAVSGSLETDQRRLANPRQYRLTRWVSRSLDADDSAISEVVPPANQPSGR